MKFVEVKHPEGDSKLINLERITTVYYRSARENEGGAASLNIDVADTEHDILLHGREADRVWQIFQSLVQADGDGQAHAGV